MDKKSSRSSWKNRLAGILLAGLFAFSNLSPTRAASLPVDEPPLPAAPVTQGMTTGTYSYYFPVLGNQWLFGADPQYAINRKGPAFDACNLPNLASLQTWWTSSPYRIVNIYLGGPAFPTDTTTCNYTGLNSAWLSSADRQGWTFILTWAGWQAPCRGGSISYDKNTAYRQGKEQADAAVARAKALGFTKDLIIYDDIEAYNDPGSGACHQAVAWFVSGWVDEIHRWGGQAGVYGIPRNLNAYWTKTSSVPDDIWMAYWYATTYDPDASVFDIPDQYLSDSLWAYHQRILQYAGDHGERYGGVTISGIDSDVVDGTVQAYGFNGLASAGPAQPLTTQSIGVPIQGTQVLSPSQGWAWTDSRLWSTQDNGSTWQEITPTAMASGRIMDVDFQDAKQGWAAERAYAAGGIRIFRTEDGGQTWQDSTLPDPDGDLAFAAGSLDLDFVDAQTGWASVKLQTSAIFSQGKLFRTVDGGKTWQQVSTPVGGEIHFMDDQHGWLAGGLGGGELLETRDGGLTWQPRDPAATAADQPGNRSYKLPVFTSPDEGLVSVTRTDDDPRLEIYATHDRGQAWTLALTVPLASQGSITGGLPLYSAGSGRWLVALPDGSLLSIVKEDGRLSGEVIHPQGLPAGVQAIDTAGGADAWAQTWNGGCSGEKNSADFQCTEQSQVFQTADGGLSWTEITPPG